MSLPRQFFDIESEEFAARVNIASSLSVFIEALSEDPAIINLVEYIRENLFYPLNVLNRIKTLIGIDVDYRYANPHDTALAAYAWAFRIASIPEAASIAAELLVGARQIWWAREIASLILEELPHPGSATKMKSIWEGEEIFSISTVTHSNNAVVSSALLRNAGKLLFIKPISLGADPDTIPILEWVDWGGSLQDPAFVNATIASLPERQFIADWRE